MKRTFALSLLLFGLMSCSLLDENNPDPQPSNTAPTVTLSASTRSGVAPLSVTFTATASDAENDTLTYTWSVAGAANSPTANQTFTAAGSYPVSVTVSDGQLEASASTNITVTGSGTNPNPPTTPPTDPNPPTNPPTDPDLNDITLSVKASPGGPVPWGVTYEVKTTDNMPKGSKLSVTCAGQPAADLSTFKELEVKNVFSCIHLTNGEQVVSTLKDKDGEVLAQQEQTADVQPTASVPFGGAWEYDGVTGDSFNESAEFSVDYQAGDMSTGTGSGEYFTENLEEPLSGKFTLSTRANVLSLTSSITKSSPYDGDYDFDRTLVFVGTYSGAPKRVQVFLAPNTQEFDSNEGYLYTVR